MPTSDPITEAAATRPFADTLSQINRGAVADELAVKLAELVRAVQATGKPGSVSLVVKVAPYKGNARTVEIAAVTSLKKPVDHPHAGVFYADDAGLLSRDDPQQPSLPLIDADRTTAKEYI